MNQISNGEKFSTLSLQASLFLIALSAPISIAATQTAWSLALLFWLIRLIFVRSRLRRVPFDLAVLVFVGLTLVSSIFSYDQEISLRKMVPVSLVTIVYLVSEYTTTRRQLHRLFAILLVSCFASCIYTFATLAVGKNLKLQSLSINSPLKQAGVETGDTVLKANGISISSPEDLYTAISQHSIEGSSSITIYRHELIKTFALNSANFTFSDLGILKWSRGRDTRAAGFYGHYVTFAEVLQLIASLALGLFVALNGKIFSRNRILLIVALAAYGLALFLTITRASWLSFLISAGVMILLGTSRRTILICGVISIPLAVGGLFFLQQKRQVGFFDAADGSTSWRLTVWREGFDLLTSKPRHLAVGVGMDSIKNHYREWHLFDDGRLPMGHMHSTPLQFALERGFPTLIAWIIWMFIYLQMLWRKLRENKLEWIERGILLGAFGGTIGFLTSGLVHYNWGDSEVAMVFYVIMGFSLAIIRKIDNPQPVEVVA
ncbi:MAG: O-antigen ligase family protein [Chloracidobacterium sp.]|nr:O-antigen ligase family protein [Chloracidobacterium sp.]